MNARDPFRSLERLASARPWLEAQNARTTAFLDALPDRGITRRVEALLRMGFVGNPQLAGERLFFVRREDAAAARLFVLENGKHRLLVDPLAEGGERTTIDWYQASPSGALVAYGLSRAGREQSTLHVKRVDSGHSLDLAIKGARDGSVAFVSDDSGFYYTRVVEPRELNRAVMFHELASGSVDKQIFRRRRGRISWPSVKLSGDDRYLAIISETSFTNTQVFILDRQHGHLTTVAAGLDSTTTNPRFVGSKMLALTNHLAPRGRIVSILLANPRPAHWRTVVPESGQVLKGFEVVGDHLIVRTEDRGASRLLVHDQRGKSCGEIPLVVPGTIQRLTAEARGARAVFTFTSFTYPDALFEIDLDQKPWRPRLLVAPAAAGRIDPGAFVVRRLSYPSSDGTRVPLFVLHKKGQVKNPPARTLLRGYGCYGVSMSPRFYADALVWAERGGTWAMANIRGGGELGQKWHRAGMLANKPQSFRDFEYAMRYLLRERFTTVDQLAIEGSSCGGLLIGAMMTRAPYLFSCAISHHGMYDMLRMHKFSDGRVHAAELGSADNPEQGRFLWGYSPLHQVIPGVRYPALFATAGENDPRVPWPHTAKFIASLQHASHSRRPILMRFKEKTGHGRGATAAERKKVLVESLKFAEVETSPAGRGTKRDEEYSADCR